MDVDERIDDLRCESSVSSVASGYVRYVDIRQLTCLAKSYHIKIRVLRRVDVEFGVLQIVDSAVKANFAS